MLSLSEDTQSDNIETFNSTSRYLDDLLNIPRPHFWIYIYLYRMVLSRLNL